MPSREDCPLNPCTCSFYGEQLCPFFTTEQEAESR